jgi:hypothetical protein
MGKVGSKPKKYACFTPQQQEAYEKLIERQRKYVDYRGLGYKRTDSYEMAGFKGNRTAQAAYNLEARNKTIQELIACLQGQKKVTDLTKQDSDLNKQIDALAKQEGAEKMLEVIEGADGETAKRIKFYRDIMNGKIKTVRKTTRYNAMGGKIETKVEEVDDIDARIKARKELDKILGLNQMPDLDKLQVGDITINIVDASKKEEIEDKNNVVVLNEDDVEIIDGEKVIVESEKIERVTEKDKFYNRVVN